MQLDANDVGLIVLAVVLILGLILMACFYADVVKGCDYLIENPTYGSDFKGFTDDRLQHGRLLTLRDWARTRWPATVPARSHSSPSQAYLRWSTLADAALL